MKKNRDPFAGLDVERWKRAEVAALALKTELIWVDYSLTETVNNVLRRIEAHRKTAEDLAEEANVASSAGSAGGRRRDVGAAASRKEGKRTPPQW